MYVCMYVCVYVCMCIYIYIYNPESQYGDWPWTLRGQQTMRAVQLLNVQKPIHD